MRAALIAFGMALTTSAALSQTDPRAKAVEEERIRNEEVIRQLQAFDVLAPKPATQADAAFARPDEIVVPNVEIYCMAAGPCNEAAARLCADLGYKASRPLRPRSASSGVVCAR